MKRSFIVGISGAVALAAIVGGYWAGMRSGIELAHGSHAAETGAVAVAELTLLEAGHTDKAKLFLEAGVEDGLAGWSDLTIMRSRLSEYVFGSGLPPFDEERLVRRLAQYRKTHPSPWAVPAGVAVVESLDPELNWRPL